MSGRWLIPSVACIALSPALALASQCPDLDELADEIAAYRDADAARGVRLGEQALADARDRDHRCLPGEAMLLAAVGNNLHILGRSREALTNYQTALDLLGDDADPLMLAIVHRRAGVAFDDLRSYDRALDHYLAALQASETAGDQIESAKTAGNIGNLYNALGELERSREYHLLALEGFEESGWLPGVAGTLINLGANAAKLADADDDPDARQRHNELLLQYNRRALDLFGALDNPRGVAYAASNVGLALHRLGDPESALPYHLQSLALRREVGDRHGIIHSLYTTVDTLIALGDLDAAETRLLEAEAQVPEDIPALQLAVQQRWVELEASRGNYAEALQRKRGVASLQQEIADEAQRSRVAELRIRYDTDRSEQEIALLRSESELARLRFERQRLVMIVGAVIAALLVILTIVVYSRYRIGVTTSRELQRIARTDPMTGLSNRRDMREKINYELLRTRRTARPFAVIMADIDDFKAVNDDHGHQAGDNLVITIARQLRDKVRAQDTVARWGGEEFLFLLPETDEEGAVQLARKLCREIAESRFWVGEHRLDITATLGVAQYWPGMTVDDLIAAADLAMYQGKQQGRNTVVTGRRHGPVR